MKSILQPYKELQIEGEQLFIMADLSIPKRAFSTLLNKAADLVDAGELPENKIIDYLVNGLRPQMYGFSNPMLVEYYLRTYITNICKSEGLAFAYT